MSPHLRRRELKLQGNLAVIPSPCYVATTSLELVLESISSMETRFSHGGLELEKEKAIFVKISMGGIKNLVSIFLCVGI
ncbi:hypothetical protein P8452_04353 [Trifolium repens]|nr:hypothetical protein P8452_04353 [Trifolium repens]